MPPVDAVIVSYNSRDALRGCVEPLVGIAGVQVYVVDNHSSDGCLETVADLPAVLLAQPDNRGFAHGCNVGMRAGRAPYVLLLNPDAIMGAAALDKLVSVLEGDPRVGVVGPQIREADGTLDHSLRRFPRVRTSFARAFYLHHLFPRASWSDEMIRDPAAYERPRSAEWISGACMLVRRDLLERLGGLDEGFFLYSEDTDLCRRIHDAGFDVRYEPAAVIMHAGGGSAPRASLFPVLAESRFRYARKHGGRVAAVLERIAAVLEALPRTVTSAGRAGHVRTLPVALGIRRATP